MAIFTKSQVDKFDKDDAEIAPWAAEIISETDNINYVENKLEEYFEAGVQVVPHIFPNIQKVYVYTSPTEVKNCKGNIVCSSQPAINDFDIAAIAIFSKK